MDTLAQYNMGKSKYEKYPYFDAGFARGLLFSERSL